jgi:hypothetical protein
MYCLMTMLKRPEIRSRLERCDAHAQDMMHFVARSTVQISLAVAVLTVPASNLYAQDECQCTAPGAESSRIANAIGGGLFAGLLAAVIPFHHAGALAAAAPAAGVGGPSALTVMSDSTDIAPGDSTKPRRAGTYAAAPSPAGDPGVGPPLARTSNGEAGTPIPSITSDEAVADGMIAPKTATILPALAMIGIGSMLLGIFFLRIRRPRLRSR